MVFKAGANSLLGSIDFCPVPPPGGLALGVYCGVFSSQIFGFTSNGDPPPDLSLTSSVTTTYIEWLASFGDILQ